MRGLVIRNTGSWYVVRTDDGRLVNSKIKGNFRLKGIRSTNPVAVGDYVQIAVNPEGTAFITEIEDRRNYVIRKASNLSKQSHILAANVDLSLLLVTVSRPETSTTFVDRFLASAEAYRIPVVLVFNKTDCYTEDERRYMEAVMTLYDTIGYACHACSALQGTGMDALRDMLRDKTTLLSGNSGVGKSTLLNALRRRKSPPPTTQACTPLPSARCSTCPEEEASSTRRASKVLARSTSKKKKWPTISARYSANRPVASTATAPTPTNRDAPCAAPWRNTASAKAATPPT